MALFSYSKNNAHVHTKLPHMIYHKVVFLFKWLGSMFTAYAKKWRCAHREFQKEYPVGKHCIWEAAGNRPDICLFFSSAAVMHLAKLLWLSKWEFCFCTIIHWILTHYQGKVEYYGIHKTSDPLFWTLPTHQAPCRLSSCKKRSSTHWATWNGTPLLLPASRMMGIVLCYRAILKGSPSYPTAAAYCILPAIPFAIAVCDLTPNILQADILIEGALAWY